MTEKIFETELGNIHYWVNQIDIDKPTLIFLPGLSADHRLFDKQIEFFESKFNCIVWDAPAHGKSRPFILEFSMEDMATYLYKILQSEKIEKGILIGQSLGGYISQVFMEQYPNFASGFISIDSCSLKRKYYTWWEIALLKNTKWMYMSFPFKLLIKLGVKGTATTEYGRNLIKEIWADYNKDEYCTLADFGYKILAKSVEANKKYDINCPTLLLCGKKDNAGSAKRYNKEWTKQDLHKLVWIENAGHNSNTDNPEQVNQLIIDFIHSL